MSIEDEVRQILIAARVANDNRAELTSSSMRQRSRRSGAKPPRRRGHGRKKVTPIIEEKTPPPSMRGKASREDEAPRIFSAQNRRLLIYCGALALIVAIVHALVLGVSMGKSMRGSGFRHEGAAWQFTEPPQGGGRGNH